MGFSKEASRQALMDNGNNLEAALNVLLNSNKQKPVMGPPLRGIIHYRFKKKNQLLMQSVQITTNCLFFHLS